MRASVLCCGIAIGVVACAPAPTHASPCESLAKLDRPGTTIKSASVVAGGTFRSPRAARHPSPEIFNSFDRLPAFCRLQAMVSPTNDSRINVEVWLPIAGWNGLYLGVGNGGYAGSIAYPRLGEAVNSGFASASTDTGHEADSRDTRWANGHPEKQIDFDYRAVHEMTLFAKAAIYAFYEKPIRNSYFSSCSNGGRQGLMEAERYPDDYDGVLSGAPAFRWGFETFLSGRLDAFRTRGSKLVIYHGSKDRPEATIDYYDRLVARLGKKNVDDFARLYVVPGMGHCGSGDVPNDFGQWVRPNADPQHSMLSALEAWVEKAVPPESIIATQYRVDGDTASGIVR
ncbi:MAG TPA: tannase/feruloyl esterase family alpha/beta hydrolase, partial [Gemmatimonadaceae bacterium]|nr:tannase/feruloyl esterase family alpha/beta hydrolase [Gemmatimonadaceae bacterium]